jgi:ankyrin repeat protein
MIVAGLTALHVAATVGNAEFVEKLLTIPGILVDPKNDAGATPLYMGRL